MLYISLVNINKQLVIDLWKISCILRVLQFPPPLNILLKLPILLILIRVGSDNGSEGCAIKICSVRPQTTHRGFRPAGRYQVIYNTESLINDHRCVVFVECHTPCMIKIPLVNFRKESAHYNRYKRLFLIFLFKLSINILSITTVCVFYSSHIFVSY